VAVRRHWERALVDGAAMGLLTLAFMALGSRAWTSLLAAFLATWAIRILFAALVRGR